MLIISETKSQRAVQTAVMTSGSYVTRSVVKVWPLQWRNAGSTLAIHLNLSVTILPNKRKWIREIGSRYRTISTQLTNDLNIFNYILENLLAREGLRRMDASNESCYPTWHNVHMIPKLTWGYSWKPDWIDNNFYWDKQKVAIEYNKNSAI
jgi:hypothetical protein